MSVSEDLARRALAAAAEQEKTGDKVVAKAMLAVASSGTVRALVAEAVAAAAAVLPRLRDLAPEMAPAELGRRLYGRAEEAWRENCSGRDLRRQYFVAALRLVDGVVAELEAERESRELWAERTA